MKLLAVIFFALPLIGQQPDPYLEAARKAETSGNLARAEQEYEKLLAVHPDASIYQRLGLVRHLQNRFSAAIPAFQSSIKLNPDQWPSHLFLGIDLYRTNQFDRAFNELTKANQLKQDDPEIRFWLGVTHLAKKDYFPGLEILEELSRQQPKNLEILRTLAETYAIVGTALLNNVAEKHPDSAAGLMVHAQALEMEGAYGEALAAYRAVERKWPGRFAAQESVERLRSIVSVLPPHSAEATAEGSPIPP